MSASLLRRQQTPRPPPRPSDLPARRPRRVAAAPRRQPPRRQAPPPRPPPHLRLLPHPRRGRRPAGLPPPPSPPCPRCRPPHPCRRRRHGQMTPLRHPQRTPSPATAASPLASWRGGSRREYNRRRHYCRCRRYRHCRPPLAKEGAERHPAGGSDTATAHRQGRDICQWRAGHRQAGRGMQQRQRLPQPSQPPQTPQPQTPAPTQAAGTRHRRCPRRHAVPAPWRWQVPAAAKKKKKKKSGLAAGHTVALSRGGAPGRPPRAHQAPPLTRRRGDVRPTSGSRPRTRSQRGRKRRRGDTQPNTT